MSYKINVPMQYSNDKGESGSFDKRTGKNTLVILTVDNLKLFPEFAKIGQFTDRLVIRATLKAKPKQLVIPATDYRYGPELYLSGFQANVEYTMQIRLLQLTSVKEVDKALSGKKPKVKVTGVLNQFKFKYVPGYDPADIQTLNVTPKISVPATEDLLNLPKTFNTVVKPKSSVF